MCPWHNSLSLIKYAICPSCLPTPTDISQGLLPNTLAYLICPSLTKMAMLCVLYRINPSVIYRCTVVGVGIAIFTYTLALTSITGGPCNPLKTGTTQCLENVALAQAVLNIISDFAIVIVPIPTIHALHLTAKQKISLGCLLTLGSGYASFSCPLASRVLSSSPMQCR